MKPRIIWRFFFVALPLALRSLAVQIPSNFLVIVFPSGFSRRFLNAKEGDVVKFSFSSKSDTLTQSSFDNPCTPSGGIDVHGPGQFAYTASSSTGEMFFFNQNSPTCREAIFSMNESQDRRTQYRQNAVNAAPPDSGQDVSQGTPPGNNQPQPEGPDNAASPGSSGGQVNNNNPPPTNTGIDGVSASPAPTDVKTTAAATPTTLSYSYMSAIAPTAPSTVSMIGAGPVPNSSPYVSIVSASGMPETSSTSEATPPWGGETSSDHQHHSKQNIAAITIGVILGVLAIIAILATLTVVLLRKRRAALLPTTAVTPTIPPKTSPPPPRSRFKFAALPSKWRGLPPSSRAHAWNHLSEKEERRVSPFIRIPDPVVDVHSSGGGSGRTSMRSVSSAEQIVTRTDSPTMGRRASGSTLVGGGSIRGWDSAAVGAGVGVGAGGWRRRSGSFASLFVEAVSELGTEGSVRKEVSRGRDAAKSSDSLSSGPTSLRSALHGERGDVPNPFV